MDQEKPQDPQVTSWASPNEHLMYFEYSSWLVLNLQKRWLGWMGFKKSLLTATGSPFWSPQFALLTFFQFRNNSNKLCENYNWAPKGDDFNVTISTPSEPFGRDLKAHLATEAAPATH